MDLLLSRKRQIYFLACVTIIYIIAQSFVIIHDDTALSRGLWLEHRGVKELVDAGRAEKSEWTPVFKIISDHHFWFLRAGLILTAVLALYYKNRDEKRYLLYRNISISAVIILILSAGIITWSLKIFIGKPRPYTKLTEYMPLLFSSRFQSFPSGHTTETFAYIVPYIYFIKRALPAAVIFIFGLALSLLRVILAYHYITDVIFGVYITVFIGYIVCFYLEKRAVKN